ILFEGDAEMVVARTLGGGDIAFLTGHVSFLGALDDWPLRVIQEDGQVTFAVHGGFVEVSNDRVTVLSDVAEQSNAVDVARAGAARENAEAALRADPDDTEAQAAFRRATVRLEVAGAT
ncbi:MAG: F-type H+-transporting ATPase subunit epsilon, partial [Actinomycetota bacterium]|nr:F-type H+-transporting ATPase subunit epsilon [Actinomycetota bacterium]